MSGIKRFILAALMLIAFAGFLTITGTGASSSGGACLSTFLYPSAQEPGKRLAGRINMPLTHLDKAQWGKQDGKDVLFIVDTSGRGFIGEVCMTGDFTNPDVEFIQ